MKDVAPRRCRSWLPPPGMELLGEGPKEMEKPIPIKKPWTRRGAMPVQVLCLLCFLLIGCRGTVRHEGFAMAGPDAFLYSAHDRAVMTARRFRETGALQVLSSLYPLRRDWIVDALRFHGMCPDGYVIDTRRSVPDAVGPFGNGGDVLYSGHCVNNVPPPVTLGQEQQDEVFEK